jgi:uncharacterized damage-inducible protein DinB
MAQQGWVDWVRSMQQFFEKTTEVFTEEDSDFKPTDESFTVAGQIAHTAQCVEWFEQGGFTDADFRMDFEAMEAEARAVTSLAEARAWLSRAFDSLADRLSGMEEAALHEPLPTTKSLFAGEPRVQILSGVCDHTAHHRGALAVYARLRGKPSPMPYM